VGLLGLRTHYPCTYWAQSPSRWLWIIRE